MEKSLAVIIGLSSEHGIDQAKNFANAGFELLIVSNHDEIFTLQAELDHLDCKVEAIKLNLATYAGVEHLYQRLQSNKNYMDAIVLNLNSKSHLSDSFLERDLREDINLINLNIFAAVHLLKRIIPGMRIRGNGKIIFSFPLETTLDAVYQATKSFLTSFANSLREELKGSGVNITVLNPGSSDLVVSNSFSNNSDQSENFLEKLQGYALSILPEKVKTQIHRKWSGQGAHHH